MAQISLRSACRSHTFASRNVQVFLGPNALRSIILSPTTQSPEAKQRKDQVGWQYKNSPYATQAEYLEQYHRRVPEGLECSPRIHIAPSLNHFAHRYSAAED